VPGAARPAPTGPSEKPVTPPPITHHLKPRLATALFRHYLRTCIPLGPDRATPPACARPEAVFAERQQPRTAPTTDRPTWRSVSHPTPYPVRLAEEITRQLGELADHLAQLPPHQAAQVITRVLDPDDGVLSGITHLMATSSVFAKNQAARDALWAEVWLALGRASNQLDDIALDLDEHHDTLRLARTQPPATAAKPPAAAPLVIRRHR
jgi:hypothetical protein